MNVSGELPFVALHTLLVMGISARLEDHLLQSQVRLLATKDAPLLDKETNMLSLQLQLAGSRLHA